MQENIHQLNPRDLNKKIYLPFDSIGHVQQIVQSEKSKQQHKHINLRIKIWMRWMTHFWQDDKDE